MIAWLGVALIGAGVVWQNVAPVGAWGLVLIIIGFAVGFATRQMKFARTPLDWPVLLVLAMSGISLWVTVFFEITSMQVFRLWSGIAGLYAVVYWTKERARFTWIIVGLSCACMALALSSFMIVRWPQTKFFFVPQTLYSFFPLLVSNVVHPNVMASLLILCLPVPLAFLLLPAPVVGENPKLRLAEKLFWTGSVVLVSLVLLLTKSRGGYIAGFAAVCLALWLAGQRRLVAGLLLVGLITGIGILSATESSEFLRDFVGDSTNPSTLAFRVTVWRVALWMASDFPFTGVGMGTFNDVSPLLYPFREMQNPGVHNVYLQACVDLGIPGMIGYLAILGLTVWMALRAQRYFVCTGSIALRALTIGATAGLVGLMVHGLIDNTMWNTRIAFLPWLIVGVVVALYQYARFEMLVIMVRDI